MSDPTAVVVTPDAATAPIVPTTETPVAPPTETTLADLQTALAELGLTPAQIKGRLEAGKKNEQRAKENAEKALAFDALEEANKTELERVQARAAAAEAALAERDAKEALAALVTEVADLKKVPAAILRGATREELEDHADTYLASLPVIPNVPSADGLGNVGSTVTGSDSDLDAAIAAAEKARNFPLAITLKQQKAAKKG